MSPRELPVVDRQDVNLPAEIRARWNRLSRHYGLIESLSERLRDRKKKGRGAPTDEGAHARTLPDERLDKVTPNEAASPGNQHFSALP